MKRRVCLMLGAFGVALSGACSPLAGGQGTAPSATLLMASAQCGATAGGLKVFTDNEQWAQHWATLKKPVPENAVDFDDHQIVWISMGTQTSGGYGISLSENAVSLSEETLTIVTRWQQPKPGSFQTTVMTSPCAFVLVSKGQYRQVKVVDEEGKDHGLVFVP